MRNKGFESTLEKLLEIGGMEKVGVFRTEITPRPLRRY